MPSHIIDITLPRNHVTAENYAEDEYLLNQLDGINDAPSEDGLPFRKWLLREVHEGLKKNPKMTQITLRPKEDKSCRSEFRFSIPLDD